MAIAYKTCADNGEMTVPYNCNTCVEESGGMNGVAFIAESLFLATTPPTAANFKSITWWETQIEAGNIMIIPATRGTFDGGTPNTIPAFRTDEKENTKSKTFVAVFNSRNHKDNVTFFEELQNAFKGYRFAWNSGKELRVAKAPIQNFDSKDPVEEDFNTQLRWENTVTWEQDKPNLTVPVYDLAENQDIIDLFSKCIDTITP